MGHVVDVERQAGRASMKPVEWIVVAVAILSLVIVIALVVRGPDKPITPLKAVAELTQS